MTLAKNLEIKAKQMKRQITAVYYAYLDKRVKLAPKIIIGIAILYALSPIDLIPDFIPVLGYLDDLILVPALIALAIRLIPGEVMIAAQARAQQEPLTLHKNWTFAVVFMTLWLLAACWMVSLIKSWMLLPAVA